MLPRVIEYEDFDGNPHKETFYFHLSKPELIELEVGVGDGFSAFLQRIVKADNKPELVKWFKKIILMSYGIKSEDGRRFIKSEEISTEFSQTAAYSVLFDELASDENKAVEFLTGVFPKDMIEQPDQDKPVLVPQQKSNPAPPMPPNLQG